MPQAEKNILKTKLEKLAFESAVHAITTSDKNSDEISEKWAKDFNTKSVTTLMNLLETSEDYALKTFDGNIANAKTIADTMTFLENADAFFPTNTVHGAENQAGALRLNSSTDDRYNAHAESVKSFINNQIDYVHHEDGEKSIPTVGTVQHIARVETAKDAVTGWAIDGVAAVTNTGVFLVTPNNRVYKRLENGTYEPVLSREERKRLDYAQQQTGLPQAYF